VRYYALRSIGGTRNEKVAAAARRLIDDDPAPQVRLAAIDVLGRLDAADAVSVLQPLIHSDQDDIARAAIRALGHTTDSRAAEVLSDVLRSADPSRRIEAVVAIGARGGTEAADTLQWAAAAESDESVASEAISALARVGSREGADGSAATAALVSLTAEPARREASVAALSALPARRIGDVAKGLRHPSPDVRRATTQALSRMKNPEASYLVERALEDEAAEVRATAAAELRRLGSRSAARKLLALARTDPDVEVRHAAVMAVTQPSGNARPADLRDEG
jgi:HEAT repeat protein